MSKRSFNGFKRVVYGISLLLAFPLALLSGFGRSRTLFSMGAHCSALVPGLPGDFLRTAYYRLTLSQFAPGSRIQFGSFFAHPEAIVGDGVYIGSYCILGRTNIGARTQIASGVQILSGGGQHPRDSEGRILGSESGTFETVVIGADCWIGAGSVVMAGIGNGTTIGAGSVVAYPVPANCVAIGNPARVITISAAP